MKGAIWKQVPKKDATHNLACYCAVYIARFDRHIIPIELGGCTVNSAPFLKVDGQLANNVGRNILPQIRIKLHRENETTNWYQTSIKRTNRALKQQVGSKNNKDNIKKSQDQNVVITEFVENFKAVQQKGRRVPIQLKKRVEQEKIKTIRKNHVNKLEKFSDRQLIGPIDITVKKDQSRKLALDSELINK